MSFLKDLMESTKEFESPRNFWLWSGIATISAVVKDNIWLERGKKKGGDASLYKLYPNIYVMLHAESGLKKGPPVNLAKRLVKRVNNTRIISGRSSIQGMLKELGTAYTVPGGSVISKSVAFIVASEFSSSIVEDKAAMTILTDLYDRNWNEGDWKSLLKMETFQLKDPTVTLLVATNEAHFDDFIQKKDVNGGFIGRMFVVVEKEPARLNSLINEVEEVPDEVELSKHLFEIAKLKGPFRSLSETVAGQHYDDWYNDFYKSIKDIAYKDETGTIQRFGDSVLKVAMLLALSREASLEITEDDMIEAIERCERLIGNVRQATVGKAVMEKNLAELKAVLVKELISREGYQMSREQILKKLWLVFNADKLNDTVENLIQGGWMFQDSMGGKIIYRLRDSAAEEFKEFFHGRSKRKR